MKIETTIIRNLIYNDEYLRKVLPFLKGEYFAENSEKIIFNEVVSFTNKYNKLASIEAIGIAIKEKNNITDDQGFTPSLPIYVTSFT